ncbi:MAG: hypothetical protein LBD68_10015 [Zoogloeaceae bacterium]|jgi:hypothetical protein|nr:hypothetical protein [Zoogloeaceae bacterium]
MSRFFVDFGGTVFLGAWVMLLWRMFCRSRHGTPVLRALCARLFFISLALALAAELTIFNWSCYLKFWAGERVVYSAKDFELQEAGTGIKLKNLNHHITSLHFDMPLLRDDAQVLQISYTDEAATIWHNATLYGFTPRSRYVALSPHGKVSEIGIYSNKKLQIDAVTINPAIPFRIFILRIALVAILLFMLCLWISRKARDKLGFLLFDYSVDTGSESQKILYWGMIVSMIALCFFTAITGSMAVDNTNFAARQGMQKIYPLMADALLKGQLHLDVEVSPDLQNSANPYDPADRGLNKVEEYADFSYYNGKYYSYFGVIPVLLLFAPFKFLTGHDFPTYLGVFVFSAMICLFLALLWREMVRRFMPDMPFFFYWLGGLSFVMVSCILFLCRHPVAYELAIAAALMFLALGLFLFINAFSDRENFRVKFFFASLSFALAVGCRPTAVFMFLLALLFTGYGVGYLRAAQSSRLVSAQFVLTCLVLPYAIVALPLMWYNYARFGSIMDFGAFHQLTLANMKALSLTNPIGKLLKMAYAFQAYFFNPLGFSSHFPFVTLKLDFVPYHRYDSTLPVYIFNSATIGLINLPILWILLNIRRIGAFLKANEAMLHKLLLLSLGVGLLHIFFLSLNAGVLIRYSVDFLWLFTLAALICAYFTYRIHADNALLAKVILKFFYVSCAASVLVCFFLSFLRFSSGKLNLTYPPVYYYLQNIFSMT